MVAAATHYPQQYCDDDDNDDDDHDYNDMNGDSISSSNDDEDDEEDYHNTVNVNPASGRGAGGGRMQIMQSSPNNDYYYDNNGDDFAYGDGGGGGVGGLDDSNYNNNNNMMMMMTNSGEDGGDSMGMGGGGMLLLDHELIATANHNHNPGNGGGAGVVVDFDDPRIASLPRILLMGPRRAGKTSIQRVVFHKMSPHETLFRLEATQLLERAVVDHTPLCRFTIWDFPGELYEGGGVGGGMMSSGSGYEFSSAAGNGGGGGADVGQDGYTDEGDRGGGGDASSPFRKNNHHHHHQHHHPGVLGNSNNDDQIFAKATALIFVLDAQDEPYDHVLQSFTDTVTRAVRSNPSIAIEVFVHKVDGELFLSDEAKYDCRRDVMQQVADELADAGLSHDAIPISYHLTSIYDHSVFEAFSRVVQRLIPELPTLESLLNVLVSTCSIEKAYLFDVASKLYISTDSSPVDMQSVELCSDMIDVVLDVSGIYGMGGGGGGGGKTSTTPGKDHQNKHQVENIRSSPFDDGNENGGGNINLGGAPETPGYLNESEFGAVDADNTLEISAVDSDAEDGEKGGITEGVVNDENDDNDDELLGKVVGNGPPSDTEDDDEDDDDDAASSAYDCESSSTIYLSNGMVLYLKEVDTMLALVCLTRAENFRKKSLINYNIGCLKRALMALPQSTTTNTAAAAAVHHQGGSGGGI